MKSLKRSNSVPLAAKPADAAPPIKRKRTASLPSLPLASVPLTPGGQATSVAGGLALPHERDQLSASAAQAVDPVIAQAKRDIDAGLVDTDMRATPGLDAALRAQLVPGPGGKPPSTGR